MSDAKIDIVTALAETFGRTLSDPAALLYIAALGGLSDQDAQRAAAIAVQRCKFFPSAADLIEFASTGGVSYEAQAALAFEELERALCHNQPSMMPPLVAAIVRQLGGFARLHAIPLTEFHTWNRKDFIAAYVTLAKENPERLAALAGPHSDISQAMISSMKRIPDRNNVAAIEGKNRKLLQSMTKTKQPNPLTRNQQQ